MRRVDLETIDFSKLQRLNAKQHFESDLFHDEELLYKVFKNMPRYKLERKQRKIELLGEGEPLPITVMPQIEYLDNDLFRAFAMEYLKNCIPLFDIKNRSKFIQDFFKIIFKVSESVETIHQDPRNIVIGDLNFDNIIIDSQLNPHITDVDSFKIDGIPNDTIPAIFDDYLKQKGIAIINNEQNDDRMCLILSTLYMLFKQNIMQVPMYEYDKTAEKLKSLRNMREIVLEIKKSPIIPEVPYLHELIFPEDTERKVVHVKTKSRQ